MQCNTAPFKPQADENLLMKCGAGVSNIENIHCFAHNVRLMHR